MFIYRFEISYPLQFLFYLLARSSKREKRVTIKRILESPRTMLNYVKRLRDIDRNVPLRANDVYRNYWKQVAKEWSLIDRP